MPNKDADWMNKWTVGVRVWMERSGEAILGPGRLELLEAIDRCRSISAAARELGMSYRRAWLLVESINRAAEETLVRRQTGGRQGGGAELTERGRAAVQIYRQVQARLEQTAAVPLARSASSSHVIVHVAAAASLENVLHCLVADFAAHQPGVSVRAIYGASDELVDAVLTGTHVDLFLSAADGPLDCLEQAGLLARQTRTVLCTNRLAAIASNAQRRKFRGPRDLLRDQTRSLALADPSCPLGNYSRAYLESFGVWNKLREQALFLDNPRVVLAAVASGQVDVGIVYQSDARATPSCRVLFTADAQQPAIRYTAALTRRGAESTPARALLTFLTSPSAHRWFQRFGFLRSRGKRSRA